MNSFLKQSIFYRNIMRNDFSNYDSDSLYDMLTKIRWAGDDCIPPHAPCGFSQISNKLGA